MSYSLSCTDLFFAWPDGDVLFDGLTFVAGPVRSGLVGRNGAGKSTLLRLIAGRLTPQRGSIRVSGELGYLPQDLTLDTSAAGRPGARHRRDPRGPSPRSSPATPRRQNFAIVGDDWDVDERAEAMLGKLGLGAIDLDRNVGELSGGETILLGLAAELLRRPDVLLLDEPTNNLDLRARRHLYDAVEQFRGALLIVSHDRELLDRVDQIGDLRKGDITWYGGNLTAYEEAVAVEQEAAERMVRSAESDVRKQKRDLIEARMKMDQRRARGPAGLRAGRHPEDRRRQPETWCAGVGRASTSGCTSERLESAQDALAEAEELVHDDDAIRVDLPKTAVPAGRIVLRLEDHVLRTGRARGPGDPRTGADRADRPERCRQDARCCRRSRVVGCRWCRSGYLPQRLDLLRDDLSIVDNLALLAPSTENQERRSRLARFLFRGRAADQPVSTLSGGERFRATLAALLLAEPPPQLLMLDEPTNNLDLASVAQLRDALASYNGALLIASHDLPFLREIGITRWLELTPESLTAIEAL